MSISKKSKTDLMDTDAADELAELAVKEFKKDRRILPFCAWAFFVVLLFVLFLAVRMYVGAQKTGETVGSTIGTAVGGAIGSFKGITTGTQAGAEAGREEGLNAKDIKVIVADIKDGLGELGKLEILTATASFRDVLGIGNDYRAFFLLRGNVVFTVDMNQVEIQPVSGAEISILLPVPECTVAIDDTATEKVAEYQKDFFTGDTQAGYEAFLKFVNQRSDELEKSLDGYDALNRQAQNAAEQQVKLLAKSICGPDKTISVHIKDRR